MLRGRFYSDEQITSTDLDNACSYLLSNTADLFNNFVYNGNTIILSGLTVTAQATASGQVNVATGIASQNGYPIHITTQQVVNILSGSPGTNTWGTGEASGSSPRIDIVVAQYATQDGNPQTRNVNNNGTITSETLNTNQQTYYALNVVHGTASSTPVAPSVPSGWFLLATINVPANATTIVSGDITDNTVSLKTSGGWLSNVSGGILSRNDSASSPELDTVSGITLKLGTTGGQLLDNTAAGYLDVSGSTNGVRFTAATIFQSAPNFSAGITGTGTTGALTAGSGILGTANTFTAGQMFNKGLGFSGVASGDRAIDFTALNASSPYLDQWANMHFTSTVASGATWGIINASNSLAIVIGVGSSNFGNMTAAGQVLAQGGIAELGYNMNGTNGGQIVSWFDNNATYGVALVENNQEGGLALVNKGTSAYNGLAAGQYTVPVIFAPNGYLATQANMAVNIGTNADYGARNVVDDGTGASTWSALATFNGGATIASGETLDLSGATVSGAPTFAGLGTFSAGITGTGTTGALTAGSGILGTANTWSAGQYSQQWWGCENYPSSSVAQGAYLGWNVSAGQGEMDFLNNKGGGTGGWQWRYWTGSAWSGAVASLDQNGSFTANGNLQTTSAGNMPLGVFSANGQVALEANTSTNHLVSLNAAGSGSQDLDIFGHGGANIGNLNLFADAVNMKGNASTTGSMAVGLAAPSSGVMFQVQMPTAANQAGVQFGSASATLLASNQLGASGFNALSQAGDQGLIAYGTGAGNGAFVVGMWDSTSNGNGVRFSQSGVQAPQMHNEDSATDGPQGLGAQAQVTTTSTTYVNVENYTATWTPQVRYVRVHGTLFNSPTGSGLGANCYVTCQGQTGPTHSILDSATAVGFTDTFDAATNGLGVTSASGAVYLEAVGATTAEFTLDGVNGGYRTATCSGAV